MDYGRTPNILHHFSEDLFHLAPIPFIYHRVQEKNTDEWHQQLIWEARRAFSESVLEVPDVRHISDMGSTPQFDDPTWSETQIPAVGVWHSVPTKNYLELEAPSVKVLKRLIEQRYLNAIAMLGDSGKHEPWISESWIQFYKQGDYKVLHNHERYGPPYPNNRWAGAYYIDDGDPDATMPYSGLLSFLVRQVNHYIRPLPGLLVMWPADILHEVHPFYGTRERVVVNFNINIKALDKASNRQ